MAEQGLLVAEPEQRVQETAVANVELGRAHKTRADVRQPRG